MIQSKNCQFPDYVRTPYQWILSFFLNILNSGVKPSLTFLHSDFFWMPPVFSLQKFSSSLTLPLCVTFTFYLVHITIGTLESLSLPLTHFPLSELFFRTWSIRDGGDTNRFKCLDKIGQWRDSEETERRGRFETND